MDWENIISVLMALLVAVGIPLALRARKKGSSQKLEQLLEHLGGIGIRASQLAKGAGPEKAGLSRASGLQRSEGVIKIERSGVDYINVVSVASQYGVNYFLDYLVRSPGLPSQRKRRRTRLVMKKSPALWGRIVDIEWKGDEYLSRELNFDYRMKDILLGVEPKELKSGISVIPEAKQEYTRIRMPYLLPSPAWVEAIDIIAEHIKKSGW